MLAGVTSTASSSSSTLSDPHNGFPNSSRLRLSISESEPFEEVSRRMAIAKDENRLVLKLLIILPSIDSSAAGKNLMVSAINVQSSCISLDGRKEGRKGGRKGGRKRITNE